MNVLSDQKLFVPLYEGGPGPVEYMQNADEAGDNASLAILFASIAKMGKKLVSDQFSPYRRGHDKDVKMDEWLTRQKLRIPLESRHMSTRNNGPITVEVIEDILRTWSFCTENIGIHVKKREYRWKYGCFVEITFTRK